MTARMWKPVLEQIRSLAASPLNAQMGDAELLSRFVAQHDETAFEALLRRHGPMVLRVARRVLSSEPDAEDVFQATFLLLARRAGAIRKRESVASWLHGVAHRLALSARGKRARRQQCERQAAARAVEAAPESSWSELEETLHAVLAQLPAKYRTPLVYCYLEGWTQEEVARQLGKPLGTVRSWLARGRELLRKRLLRRGISLSAEGASTALLASVCATAEAVPPPLRMATLKAAHLFATGGNAMTLISPPVAALMRKGLTAMLVAKLKGGAACVLILALLIAGSGWAAHRTFRAKPPEANETAEKAPPKQAATEDRPRTDVFGDPLPPGAIARLGTVRFRHEGVLDPFSLSPDGRILAATAGKSVAFWDVATGRPLRHFSFSDSMHCATFAPKGRFVTIGGESGDVQLVDLASGKVSRRFVGHPPGDTDALGVFGAVFTPDGRSLITWDSKGIVRFWDAQSGKTLRCLDGEDWIVRSLSPNGKLLAVKKGRTSRTLRLLDVATGQEILQLDHPADVKDAAFAPEGNRLAVAYGSMGQPGRIRLWELGNGKELGTLVGHKDAVLTVAFSPNGKMLASGGYDKTIRLWDLNSKKQLPKAQNLGEPVTQVAFSQDGQTLISSGWANHVRLWDMAGWRERLPADGPPWAITAIAYSPDGKLVASASGNKIWLWSTLTGKALRVLGNQEDPVSAMKFSADGKSVISGSSEGIVRFWDWNTGKEQRRILIEKGVIGAVAPSPDGKTLAVWLEAPSREIRLLNAITGANLHTIEVPSEHAGWSAFLSSLCFSSDGKTLYASSRTNFSVLCWNTATGKAMPFFGKHEGGLCGIAVCSDGRSVAAVTLDGSLYLWETASGQTRLVSKDAGFADGVVFSPDGRFLALVNTGIHSILRGNEVTHLGFENREQVRLVRVADGKVIHRFTGHIGGINGVSFSPDGRTLASAGQDTTVLLWDVTKGHKDAVKKAPPLTSEKLAELWKGLRGTAAESHGCIWTLIAAPGQAVPFLSEKLKPVVAVDAERFARLLNKLESDQFAEREEATQELKKWGDSAEPALRKALQEKLPLETRLRLQALLDDLNGDERLRALRAIKVLERIGDEPARDFLRRLSAGTVGAWLTEEARTTLRRLERRDK